MKTPMSQMQDHFKHFNELVGPLFNKLELNKKDSTYNSYINEGEGGNTKAVESDFIRIYKPSTNCASLKTSFAFAFNNFKNNLSDTVVTVSIKKDKKFETVNLDLNQFKTNFKTYVKMIELLKSSKSMSGESVIQALKTVFPVSSEYTEPNYNAILSTMQTVISEQLTQIQELQDQRTKHEKDLNKVRSSIDAKVSKFKKELEEKEGFTKLQDDTNKIFKSISITEDLVNSKIESQITSFVKQNSAIGINRLKENLRSELMKKRKKTETKFNDDFVELVLKKLSN